MTSTSTPALSPMTALAGQYRLRPGSALPIEGTRPIVGADRLSLLLRGTDQAAALQRLGHVFTLCSHAHQRAGRLAFAAAQASHETAAPSATGAAPSLALLRWETLRDHLRAMALDWPQRLGPISGSDADSAPAHAWLQSCPMPLAGSAPASEREAWAAIQALKDWLEAQVLGTPATRWLAEHDEPQALASWCQQYRCAPRSAVAAWPVLSLAQWHDRAIALQVPGRGLDALDAAPAVQRNHITALAQAIAAAPTFVQTPQWRGAPAETGPWTRLRARHQSAPGNVWTRLAARWVELVTLAAAEPLAAAATQDPLLASGALPLGPGQAIAWCEMARGLLLHWVQLDNAGWVQHYRVLAPTEWNFHPQGALAGALAALAPSDVVSAQLLAAAFDPCVDCTVLTSPSCDPEEPPHA